MVQRSVHHKSQLMGKTLAIDEVLSIRNDGAMTDHHPLRPARSACRIENVSRILWGRISPQPLGYLLESRFGHVALQGSSHAASLVQSEVLHEICHRRVGS